MSHVLNFNKWTQLNENADPKYLGYAQKIVGMLMTALNKVDDDEDGVLAALKLIPQYGGKPVYDNIIQVISTSPNVKKAMGYNFHLVASMIKSGGISDTASSSAGYYSNQHNPVADLKMGLTDEEFVKKYEAILGTYNLEEVNVL